MEKNHYNLGAKFRESLNQSSCAAKTPMSTR